MDPHRGRLLCTSPFFLICFFFCFFSFQQPYCMQGESEDGVQVAGPVAGDFRRGAGAIDCIDVLVTSHTSGDLLCLSQPSRYLLSRRLLVVFGCGQGQRCPCVLMICGCADLPRPQRCPSEPLSCQTCVLHFECSFSASKSPQIHLGWEGMLSPVLLHLGGHCQMKGYDNSTTIQRWLLGTVHSLSSAKG